MESESHALGGGTVRGVDRVEQDAYAAGRGGCDQTGAAGGVDARRWRIQSSNPAMSAASTPPPSATIQTFEPSLAGAGVAALGGSTTSSTRATGLASTPTPGSVLAGRGVSPAVSFA